MTPSPGFRHQKIAIALGAQLFAGLDGHPCEVLAAPMDVRLSAEDVIQPDVLVVCDPGKIEDTHIEGAPDLVVEIASDSTVSYDRTLKLNLYAKHGVKEYWLVTPYPHLVEVLFLDGDSYRIHGVYTNRDRLISPTLPGLVMDLETVFDFPISDEERIEQVHEAVPPYLPPKAPPTQ